MHCFHCFSAFLLDWTGGHVVIANVVAAVAGAVAANAVAELADTFKQGLKSQAKIVPGV